MEVKVEVKVSACNTCFTCIWRLGWSTVIQSIEKRDKWMQSCSNNIIEAPISPGVDQHLNAPQIKVARRQASG